MGRWISVRTGAQAEWRAAHWLTFRGKPPQLDYDREGYAKRDGEAAGTLHLSWEWLVIGQHLSPAKGACGANRFR
ncbi:hypothetical protein GCM10010177_14910 [Actinomadura citrea]|nr:hypothetical protein GCM10010177_14910 [Actinomadura citrea]